MKYFLIINNTRIEFGTYQEAESYALANSLEPNDIQSCSLDSIDMTPDIILKKIKKSKEKFEELSTEYAASNVLQGITQAGKTKLIADALADVMRYGQSGSLYEVKNAINALVITAEMDPYLTETIRTDMLAKVQAIIDNL